jgi:hypothetical protein
LGAAFFAGETLLAAGSIIATAEAFYNESQAATAFERGDNAAIQYQDRARTAAYASEGLAAGFILAAVVGVLHAELTFVPQRTEIHRRAIPPLSLAPVVGPGSIGISGTF